MIFSFSLYNFSLLTDGYQHNTLAIIIIVSVFVSEVQNKINYTQGE